MATLVLSKQNISSIVPRCTSLNLVDGLKNMLVKVKGKVPALN